MKYFLSALLLFPVLFAHSSDGETILSKMYQRYHGKWYQTFRFNQTTEIYRNDSLRRTETWHEAASFPDKFRIDFGSADSGNAVIFSGDSSYNYRKGQLRAVRRDANDLTFLLGGLYFYPYPETVARIKALGYDLNRACETTWKDKPVYVIGIGSPTEKQNQLWIDRDKLIVVRFIKYDNGRKEEGLFEDHIPAAGGWTETKAIFYFDDKLVQKEFYHDFEANAELRRGIFKGRKSN